MGFKHSFKEASKTNISDNVYSGNISNCFSTDKLTKSVIIYGCKSNGRRPRKNGADLLPSITTGGSTGRCFSIYWWIF